LIAVISASVGNRALRSVTAWLAWSREKTR
jgi:hypothetical protein